MAMGEPPEIASNVCPQVSHAGAKGKTTFGA
jgi:hypothetical protein